MLQNRIPIRHPRNIVGHRAGAARGAVGGFGVEGEVAVFGGHEANVFEEGAEEAFEDSAGFGVRAEHLVVLVDVLAQKLHELLVLLPGGVAEANEGLGEGADVIDGLRAGFVEAGLAGADEVDNDVVDHPADHLVDEATVAEVGVLGEDDIVLAAEEA